MQQSGQILLIRQEVHDKNLLIGENILSQHWIQKLLQNNYFLNKNLFRYAWLKTMKNVIKHGDNNIFVALSHRRQKSFVFCFTLSLIICFLKMTV